MTTIISGATDLGLRPRVSRLMTFVLAACVAGATACGDSGTGPNAGPAGPAGHYELRGVDDENIPVEIHHGPFFDAVSGTFYNQFICSVDGGELTLDQDDERFTLTFGLTITADGQYGEFTVTVTGDYEMQGNQVLLEADDGGTTAGWLEDGRLQLMADLLGDGNPNEFLFRR